MAQHLIFDQLGTRIYSQYLEGTRFAIIAHSNKLPHIGELVYLVEGTWQGPHHGNVLTKHIHSFVTLDCFSTDIKTYIIKFN